MFVYSAIPIMQLNTAPQCQAQVPFNNGLANVVPFGNMKSKRQSFKPHSKFSEEDDSRLRELVQEYGENSWIQIANLMPGRNSRQCRERWLNYLSPKLNTNTWTPEEDSLLLEKQKEIGTSWVKISKFFEGRTDQMCKNRFFLLQRKMEKKPRKPRNIKIPPQATPAIIGTPIFIPIPSNNNINMNYYQQPQNSFQIQQQFSSTVESPISSCISSPIQENEQKKTKEDEFDAPFVSETTDLGLTESYIQDNFDSFENNANYDLICDELINTFSTAQYCDDLFSI